MSDQHPPPHGDGSQQPSYQPPPAGDSFPPPPSGPGFPPPPGGNFPPPGSDYPPPGGGTFPPPGGFDPNAAQPGYGQPGGFDPQGGQPGFGAAPGAPLPPLTPARRGGPWKIILAIAGVVLLLCCIGGIALAAKGGDWFGGGAADAKVGDCLKGEAIDQSADDFQEADLEVVKCDAKDARYAVVGRVDNKTQAQATAEVCRPFTDAEFVYWQGRDDEQGTVLCLKANA